MPGRQHYTGRGQKGHDAQLHDERLRVLRGAGNSRRHWQNALRHEGRHPQAERRRPAATAARSHHHRRLSARLQVSAHVSSRHGSFSPLYLYLSLLYYLHFIHRDCSFFHNFTFYYLVFFWARVCFLGRFLYMYKSIRLDSLELEDDRSLLFFMHASERRLNIVLAG